MSIALAVPGSCGLRFEQSRGIAGRVTVVELGPVNPWQQLCSPHMLNPVLHHSVAGTVAFVSRESIADLLSWVRYDPQKGDVEWHPHLAVFVTWAACALSLIHI